LKAQKPFEPPECKGRKSSLSRLGRELQRHVRETIASRILARGSGAEKTYLRMIESIRGDALLLKNWGGRQ